MIRKLFIIALAAVIGGAAGTAAVPYAGPYVSEVHQRLASIRKPAPPPVTAAAPQPIELAQSETFVVKPTTLHFSVALSGTLNPVKQTTVKAQVAAQVGEVLVQEGDAVKKGGVLVRIDTSDLQSALQERLANLAAAQAQLDLAKKNLDAKVQLASKGYAARMTVNEVQSAYDANAASVRAIQAQVDVAKKTLARTEVVAPMDGIVSERKVNPGDKVAVDTTLMSIVSLGEMEINAPVPTSEIGRVAVGQPVRFTVPGLAEKSFEGVVSRINPVAKAGTRSIPVYVRVKNPDGVLRGGMFASGSITVEEAKDVLAVPPAAIRGEGKETYVLKIEDGRVIRQPVLAEDQQADDLVAVSGLRAGDAIVAAAGIDLPPETPIRVSER